MKPIYAFNDYLYEIWPLDQYARKHLLEYCERNSIVFGLELTTMGTNSYRFQSDLYHKLKEILTE